ncbi:MAG TPA: protein kinase, partial [Feifaniaceae bacterium]|nr:protein kinase [Feifaniaceae bacterium]
MRENKGEGICPFCGFDSKQYAASPHHLPLKTILAGKYLIGRVLGEGGFGITYLGWDLNLGVKIAVKEYYPMGFVTREHNATSSVLPYVGDKAAFFAAGRDRFVDEAKSLAKFYGLPGIVAVKDFFLENNTAYIVMEFVEGKTLKQMLIDAGGKLPAAAVLEMMKPLMRSLSEVHDAGIIHRDISPDNIMVTKEGNVKLLDFGAARDYADSGNRSLSVLLKPGYAPEEQYRTRGIQGPWSDVYALCATIYRAITGVTPPESVERLRTDELQAPSSLGAAIEPAREKALLNGMAVLQTDRYQSVIELYEALYSEQYAAGVPLTPPRKKAPVTPKKAAQQPKTAKQPVPTAGSARRWSTPKWVALGVASLVLVSAAVFFAQAAVTGDYDENSLVGKILANSNASERAHDSDGEGGTNVSLLSSTQEVPATAISAAATPAQEDVTPTQEPTVTPAATPTNAPKREGSSEPTSAPKLAATATPKQAATATPKPTATAAPTPTATATAKPKATPTATPSTSKTWSGWATSYPSYVNSIDYFFETKTQYRNVTYTYTGTTTYYQYTYEDGSLSDWTTDASLCGTYSFSTKSEYSWSTSYSAWIDGFQFSSSPSLTEPHDYSGVELQTL